MIARSAQIVEGGMHLLRFVTAVTLASAVAIVAEWTGASTPTESIAQRIAKQFAVVDRTQQLYAVTATHLLRPSCRDGVVSQIEIEPKAGFSHLQHPEWKQDWPMGEALTETERNDTLHRIDLIQPLGKLLRRAPYGIGNATRVSFYDLYENAIVRRTSLGEHATLVIAIGYFMEVHGYVKAKEFGPTIDWFGWITIDGTTYASTKLEVERAAVGTTAAITGAAMGPIEGIDAASLRSLTEAKGGLIAGPDPEASPGRCDKAP
jgi:hypothetical protein